MIFQEPMTSLNPLFTVGDQIAEVYLEHTTQDRRSAWESVEAILGRVGIPEPGQRSRQYIHEMSGGMRQRAMIAMALACNPSLLIADEPTTALDVTIQAQILVLDARTARPTGAAILLITHNLGVVAEMADRVIVMYLGGWSKMLSAEELFNRPLHPYTRGLLASVPFPGRKSVLGKKNLAEIPGIVPSMFDMPKGCVFNPRCYALPGRVAGKRPPLLIEQGNNHQVACWAVEEGWA